MRFGNAQSFLRGREAKVVTVTVNGTLSELTMRLGSNGEAYFADGVDDFDDDEDEDEESDIELGTGDEDEVGAVEALSALRLETPPKTTRPSTSGSSGDVEDGKRTMSEEEVATAVDALQSAGMTVLPAVELSLCGGKWRSSTSTW